MATLMSVPLEIRQEVYSYLLLSTRAFSEQSTYNIRSPMQESPLPKPSISTSLFRVNQQISHEALSYFYGKNLFVAIKIHFRDLIDRVRWLFPCFILDSRLVKDRSADGLKQYFRVQRLCLEKVALIVEFQYNSLQDHALVSKNEPITLVCGVRYLEILLRFLNKAHFRWAYSTNIKGLLRFRLKHPYYVDSGKILVDTTTSAFATLKSGTREELVDNEESPGIRTVTLSAQDITTVSEYESLKTWGLQGLSQPSSSDTGSLASFRDLKLPLHSLETPLEDSSWARRQGNEERSKGNYALAENYYSAASYFYGNPFYPLPDEEELLSECECLKVDRRLRLAVNFYWAGKHEAACKTAADTLMDIRRLEYGDYCNEDEVYIKLAVASIFADSGDYDQEDNLHRAYTVLVGIGKMAETAEQKDTVSRKLERVQEKLGKLGIEEPKTVGICNLIHGRIIAD